MFGDIVVGAEVSPCPMNPAGNPALLEARTADGCSVAWHQALHISSNHQVLHLLLFWPKPTSSPEKRRFTQVTLFPAWFHSPKRAAISLWWAVLSCHITASHPSTLPFFLQQGSIFKPLLPVRFCPQITVSSKRSVKGRRQTRTKSSVCLC